MKPEPEIEIPLRWLLVALLLFGGGWLLLSGREAHRQPLPVAFLATATPLATVTPPATATPAPTPTAVYACPAPQTAFPRPANGSRRGVHWCPSTNHVPAQTERLVAEARALRLQWAVVVIGLDAWNFQEPYVSGDAHLIRSLHAAGILPIVRLPGRVGDVDLAAFQRQVTALSRLGVRYFQIGNEPNRADENSTGRPDPAAYVRWWLPRAQIVLRAGGYPGFGALDPGGEYGDLVYLKQALLLLQEQCAVLARTWLSTHLYQLGPLTTNYVTSLSGFARQQAYAAVMQEVLGYSLPQIATEAGISSLRLADWQGDPRGVAQRQAELLAAAYAGLPGAPRELLAFNPWLLANLFCDPNGDPRFEYGAFFDRQGGAQPVVERLR